MKKFKVTVDGQAYTVSVEEMEEKTAEPADRQAKMATPKAASTPAVQQTPQKPSPKPLSKTDSSEPAAGSSITAPMPGSIIEIKVNEGDTVREGDVLLILEAMKMENEVTAPQAGSITRIMVKKGDTVNSGDPLLTIG
jgi:glutaconyl-CoA/methylmalonyl-CoA decarboxylase subunit gamma